ncbi:RNA polymerase recycling motor HelD [Schleiferilactobacillus harbinensis]|uniref:RNA polymerase recycling motor HelD n=1 Tax=Schleiferilactobacillus harbinensis TaxID=304207 RepID=A0ABU7T044_9LACO
MLDTERQQEQARVDRVSQIIAQQLAAAQAELASAKAETRRLDENYGENTKVNTFEVDDRMETNAAVQQQKNMIAGQMESERILQDTEKRLTLLSASPYFGRIDIAEDGDQNTLYIGTATLMDGDDHFLVYDWRAPISALYYNGTLGPATYDAPMGRQRVDLTRKRQFQIEDGHIENMFDTNETVGDSVLQHVLGQQTDEYMRNIVSTIQKAQNDIIRNTDADLLLVQGVAGSGKTSAILQRVAYLLYHARNQLDSDQMILFSPNRLFSSYISKVLPSLGEKNMRQVTLAEFLGQRFEGLHVESLFERFETDMTSLPETAQSMRRYKESPAFMTAVRQYLQTTPPETLQFTPINFNGEIFFSQAEIQRIFMKLPAQIRLADKFLRTKNILITRLKKRLRRLAREEEIEDEVSLLDDATLAAWTRDKEFASPDDELHFLARKLVFRRYEPVYDAIYNNYFLDIYQQYAAFLATARPAAIAPKVWTEMITEFGHSIERHVLPLSDAAPLLYLRDLLTGGGQNHSIRYLFIDEMQDYSLAQISYLRHAFPKAHFTLLGDRDQDVFSAHYEAADRLAAVRQMFRGGRISAHTLNKSYRSTEEITNLAKALLPDGSDITAFARSGEKPTYIVCPHTEAIAAVSREATALLRHNKTVAILTKTAQEAESLYARLSSEVPVKLMSEHDRSLAAGILILPIYLAKGLEFDAVIAYDISAYNFGDRGTADVLYTICSRAMHNLVLIGIDRPSPLLQNVPAALFHYQDLRPTPAAI